VTATMNRPESLMAREKERDPVFAKRLRELRDAANMTQMDLAVRAGIQPMTVSKIERLKMTPTWPMVVKLAAALGVTPDAFLPQKRAR
jgi:transcriptional regulator with XRE-family HTH domain